MQQNDPPRYGCEDALTKGTLFPGLDLPFMNRANKSNPCAGTDLGKIMAVDFVVKELNLYLDTHNDDAGAFAYRKEMIALSKELKKDYVKAYGPVTLSDLDKSDSYDWLKGPWPWEKTERRGD